MSHSSGSHDVPPPLELECLKALWGLGEGSVREVRQRVVEGNRSLAYTTVMTVLARLEKRGAVTRRKHSRCFVYAPNVSREALRRSAVKELVDRLFDGSEQVLLTYLEGTRRQSELVILE